MTGPPLHIQKEIAKLTAALAAVDGLIVTQPCVACRRPRFIQEEHEAWESRGSVKVSTLASLREVNRVLTRHPFLLSRLPTEDCNLDGSVDIVFISSEKDQKITVRYEPVEGQKPLRWRSWRWEHGVMCYRAIFRTREEALRDSGLTEEQICAAKASGNVLNAGVTIVFQW